MIFNVIQTKKDLYAADFVCGNSSCVGKMHLEGGLASMEGRWSIECFDRVWNMEIRRKMSRGDKIFRPYEILEYGETVGHVYQTYQKTGVFSRYDYHHMEYHGISYDMFPIGFGREGSKSPIYMGSRQISLIEKECEVIDELHQFHVFAEDDRAAEVSVLFACYMYTNAFYVPGKKVTSSVSKTVSISTNKELKAKYDSKFKKRIQEKGE